MTTITNTFSSASGDNNVVQEEVIVHEIKQAPSIDKYITRIEPTLDLGKVKKEQGFINADKEKINALITEAGIETPIESLLADLN